MASTSCFFPRRCSGRSKQGRAIEDGLVTATGSRTIYQCGWQLRQRRGRSSARSAPPGTSSGLERQSAGMLWPKTDAAFAFVSSGDGGAADRGAAAHQPWLGAGDCYCLPDRTMYQMSLVPRLDLRPVKLKKAEHDDPGEDDRAREIGGSAADLRPSCAAPDAHKQGQVPGDVCSKHQRRKPSRRSSGKRASGRAV
jgi:hypothetical protein